MQVTATLEFPDVQEILEKSRDIDDVWQRLIEWFSRNPRNLKKMACANKLLELNNMRNSNLVTSLDEDVQELKKILREISRRYHHAIIITRRQKALLGVIAKMVLLIQEGEADGKTVFTSLERLKDFLGIRIVALTGRKDTPEAQEMVYEIMNEVLKFFVVAKNNTLSDVEYERVQHVVEGISIPKNSGILDVFRDNVKDYILYAKPNGYQRLHAVPISPNRQTIEIQVSTQEGDFRAEYEDETRHETHKLLRYEGIEIPVDLTKIKIDGIEISKKGEIYDRVGLIYGIDPLNYLR